MSCRAFSLQANRLILNMPAWQIPKVDKLKIMNYRLSITMAEIYFYGFKFSQNIDLFIFRQPMICHHRKLDP